MRSVIAVVFVGCINAQHQVRGTVSIFADKLVDGLTDQFLNVSSHGDLDGMMLGMPAHVGFLNPTSPTLPFATDPRAALRRPSYTGRVFGTMVGERVRTDMQTSQKHPVVMSPRKNSRLDLTDPRVQTQMKTLLQDPEFKPEYDKMIRTFKKGKVAEAVPFHIDPAFVHRYVQRLVHAPAVVGPQAAGMVREEQVKTLHDAIRVKGSDALRLTKKLLAAGKDPNEINKDGYTPLLVAIALKSESLVKELLAAGASTSACDKKGNTPLHYAAVVGLAPVITALLDAGADPAARNQVRKSPYDIIRRKRNCPVAKDRALMARLKFARGGLADRAQILIASLTEAVLALARLVLSPLLHVSLLP